MKDLDRGKSVVPPQAEAAHTKGQLQQELADYKRDKKRIEDEKDTLHDKLELEKTERLSFEQRLEQAMRDLGISHDEKNHAIAIVDKTIAALTQTSSDRDKAISSRNSANGKLGGLTAHRNRLLEKNEFLKNRLKLAIEQVVAANQQREAFQEGYQKIKAAYQKLKLAHQNLKIEQQNSYVRIEKLQTDFEKLKTGCKKLKVEHEKLKISHAQDVTKIATAYRKMSCVERSQLPSELKLLLDQLEGNYPG